MVILISGLAVLIAFIVGAASEQYYWNKKQQNRIKVLEMRIEILTTMLVRSPEMRQTIGEAPREAFEFKRLHH